MEGKQYKCTWQKMPDGRYIACLATNHKVAGCGETFLDARINLAVEIIKEYGDGEAVLEFVKKPPSNPIEEKFGVPGIVSVSGNVKIDPPANVCAMFSKQPCSECNSPQGKRTSERLVLTRAHSTNGMLFYYGRCLFLLFSDEFVELLRSLVGNGVKFEPVVFTKGTVPFHEVQGKPLASFRRNLAMEKAMRGMMRYHGSNCPKCKQAHFPYVIRGSEFTKFVRRRDLPKSIPDFFLLGKGTDIRLCLRQEVWFQLLKKAGTKGIVSSRVGVI